MSSLSLSSRPDQRLNENYDYEGNNNGNGRPQYHYSTSPPVSAPSQYNQLGMSQTPVKKPLRGGLPTQWLDNPASPDNRSLSPNEHSDFSSVGGSPPMSHLHAPPPMAPSTPSQSGADDDVIPTAIVIKNIPFNVKRETLLDIISSLSIPTPYAFNYHLDQQGSFRGLAFANFRMPADADAVVAGLNGFDVQGRKLRVEYKKVLQAGEKERIEREKAIRRMRSMQMEKDGGQSQYDEFGSVQSPPFTPSRSYSGTYQQATYSPPHIPPVPAMPVPQPYLAASPPMPVPSLTTPSSEKGSLPTELDLNDASTLEIYSRILLFKDDRMRDELAFSRTLSPKQRRTIHLIAQKLGVYHYSVGEGDERYAVVTRIDPNRQQPQIQRHTSHTLSRTPSAYLTPSAQMSASSLRSKKSMPDMKTLHTQTPRLNARSSNGNIREGYATIASPSRRSPGGFGSLFNNSYSAGSAIPPVPSLPSSVTGMMNGGLDSPGSASSAVRQPRGPGAGGFGSRRDRAVASESAARSGGLDTRSHEPLEI
ncbi:hypothetical protein FIBSPDRAFT_850992 [Athelia psychrophila]|uniref:R3H domain protein n=1 Tax=Athelia psychrophila TaxID=1759441 RepID=A0A166SUE8_9AGAM|nr:hypothetical protein FIBSPDRAFT_850992 [Fibularhizoctonia sp. CBS 109695]